MVFSFFGRSNKCSPRQVISIGSFFRRKVARISSVKVGSECMKAKVGNAKGDVIEGCRLSSWLRQMGI